MYYKSNQKNCSIQIKNAIVGPTPKQPEDPEKFETSTPLLFPKGINKTFVRTLFNVGYVIQSQPSNITVTVL